MGHTIVRPFGRKVKIMYKKKSRSRVWGLLGVILAAELVLMSGAVLLSASAVDWSQIHGPQAGPLLAAGCGTGCSSGLECGDGCKCIYGNCGIPCEDCPE